jgi:hypothetical protein
VIRRLTSAVAAFGLAAPLLLVPAGTVQAVEATTRVDDFRACIAGGGTPEMLLIFDESSSLNDSDPNDARVTSARYLLNQLASFADVSSAKVDVAISVFANSYSEVQGWTALNGSSLPKIQLSVDSLKDRVNGMETDYWTALDGTRKSLAARAASHPNSKSCQAAVWFTDGAINYTVRGSDADKDAFGATKPFAPKIEITSEQAAEQVKQAAMTDICRAGGVADQLRSSNVALFSIGLQGLTTNPDDFSFLQSVTAGKSSDSKKTCGKLLNPVPGEFHLASDIDSLLLAFDGISSPGSSPILQQTGICQVSLCTDQAHRFVLDASTPAVRVLATADGNTLRASLRTPSGAIVNLPQTTTGAETPAKSGSNTLRYTWLSDKTLSLSMSAGDKATGWSGLWELAFTDGDGQSAGKKSKSSIHITGDLEPKWLNSDGSRLHINEKIENVQLGIVNSSGKIIKPSSLLGTVKLRATLTSVQGKSTVIAEALDKDSLSKPLALDLNGFPAGAATFSLALLITTAATTTAAGTPVPGTTLEPVLVAVPVNLLPPAQFPVPAPRIDFGQIEGTPEVRSNLPLAGTGCAWIPAGTEPEIIASPDNVGKIDVRSPEATDPDSCAAVENSGSMTVTLKSDRPGNGTVNGRITVMTAPKGELDKAIPVKVEFTASLAKPLNSTNFLVTLLVALILGPGIPLLLLYIAKTVVTKIPGRSLSAELIPISLAGSQLLRDGQPFQFRSTDFTHLVAVKPSGTRALTIQDVNLSTRLGLSPFGAGYVLVTAPAKVGMSSTNPATDRSGLQARLPLAVHNHWVVLQDTDTGTAHLLVLTSGDAAAAQKRDLEDDINRRVPDALRRIEALIGETSATDRDSVTAFDGMSPETPRDTSVFGGLGSDANYEPTAPISTASSQQSGRAGAVRRMESAPDSRVDPDSSEDVSPWGNPYS